MADDVDANKLESLFKSASGYVRLIAAKLESDKLLYLYARFKQANEGSCNVPKPSFFDFQGKQKWEAWKKLGSMTKSQAMMEYVTLVNNIAPEWNEKAKNVTEEKKPGGLGVAVSTMYNPDDDISDDQKNVFDWCKEGNVEQVKRYLIKKTNSVDSLDDMGLALMHWASDRGYMLMVELLLSLQAAVDIKDVDGQTPLHYAVSCEHTDVVEVLLGHRADVTVKDNEGLSPLDCASETLIPILQATVKASS
ncbi:acyl-CoA-binding domain-containing protein 6-like [Gigantopelta aegis]|uniref:acyl-CoA-binding domain-containing protein 6-like n=1 Tax=Gigantopelta aegis TaxID=1735272 RepID=UPI001B887462|nr:acyl-CoA-binding domain-containing protein 6-like [Gigantopelta aegis]